MVIEDEPTEINIAGGYILGSYVNAMSWESAIKVIRGWALQRQSRYVCICNVHSIVTAYKDAEFKLALDQADLVTPDGMPVSWVLRKLGFAGQQRINGPDLMLKYCEFINGSSQSIYLYGSARDTIAKLRQSLTTAFPSLRIAGMYSPPFRMLAEKENSAVVEQINASGASVVFVSLGCPKQEIWMATNRGKINAVMIGVGAAFDYHAGTIKRAPLWMQRAGLEWLYRLAQEPRRLWRRYLVTNSIFICKVILPILLGKRT